LAIRDVTIGEELLVQRNIFLANKHVEGHHNASPATVLDHCIGKDSLR
jgi:hypothetical protein